MLTLNRHDHRWLRLHRYQAGVEEGWIESCMQCHGQWPRRESRLRRTYPTETSLRCYRSNRFARPNTFLPAYGAARFGSPFRMEHSSERARDSKDLCFRVLFHSTDGPRRLPKMSNHDSGVHQGWRYRRGRSRWCCALDVRNSSLALDGSSMSERDQCSPSFRRCLSGIVEHGLCSKPIESP